LLLRRIYDSLISENSRSEHLKMCFLDPIRLLGLAALAVLSLTIPAYSQPRPVLGVQRIAGSAQLNITGDIGSPLAVQYAAGLSPTNQWSLFTNFTLLSSPSAVVDPTGMTNRARFYRVIITVPTNMNWIPAGTFTMGSPTNEIGRIALSETQHTVTLSKGFYMARYLVTQSNYLFLINTNPSRYNTNNGYTLDLGRPVEQVSWNDATNYCFKLTQQERTAGRIFANWSYRLPTEAEWEYACRGGTTTVFYYGTNLTSGMANFNGQLEYYSGSAQTNNPSGIFLNRTTTVGGYQPNARGLYDMAGNVWEWCQDWFAGYATNSVVDPQGPATGSARVFRGGALNSPGKDCRSARRNSYDPSQAFDTVGFRIVLAAP
jgi:formylglycine-generating enzyme required for sulfatase activity